MRVLKAITIGVVMVAFGASLAFAAASDLDPSFGSGGKVITAISAGYEHVAAVAVQPDGKLLVAGDSETGPGFQFAIARYNSDGSPDTTFDGDGRLLVQVGPSNDHIGALALQPDGKIVVAGSRHNGSDPDFVVARFLPNGSFDTSFDGDGIGVTPIGTSTDVAFDVAVQPDGKIVVAGQRYNAGFNDMAVVRYNSDGSLDAGFDGDGKVVVPVVADNDLALAIALQPDGKIALAGPAKTAGFQDFAFVRLNSNGSLDSGFDGDGVLVVGLSTGDDIPRSMIRQPDGKLLAVGEANVGSTYDFGLVRLNADGSFDSSFDGDGRQTTAIGSDSDFGYDVNLQWDGKIVALGATKNGGSFDTAIVRYLPDGSIDVGFDGDGRLVSPIGAGSDYGRGLAIQPDGKYVAASDTQILGSDYDFGLQRFVGEPPPLAEPTVKITSPSRSKVRRARLRRLAGIAGPSGEIAKVEIALQKTDKKLLKRRRCLWLKNSRAKFAKTRAKAGKCSSPRFLAASGKESWAFKLRRPLPKGRYRLLVRVTLTNGRTHTTFSTPQGNLLLFRAS